MVGETRSGIEPVQRPRWRDKFTELAIRVFTPILPTIKDQALEIEAYEAGITIEELEAIKAKRANQRASAND